MSNRNILSNKRFFECTKTLQSWDRVLKLLNIIRMSQDQWLNANSVSSSCRTYSMNLHNATVHDSWQQPAQELILSIYAMNCWNYSRKTYECFNDTTGTGHGDMAFFLKSSMPRVMVVTILGTTRKINSCSPNTSIWYLKMARKKSSAVKVNLGFFSAKKIYV